MKKKIIAVALVTGLALSTTAFANWGRMGGGNWNCQQMGGPGMMNSQGGPQMMQQLDPETKSKVTQFFTDNRDLHKQIAMKRAEKMALLQNDAPDAKAVAAATGELFDLRTALMEKAEAAGVAEYIGPGMGRMGFGGPGCKGGRGYGHGKGGMQRGWQN